MSDLILHHYDSSPYSELIRLALGLKGLAWKSVIVPMIAPKPELVPLTGGYRKTPVLQVGADIYCDTALILTELEARKPDPTLYPGRSWGLAASIGGWAGGGPFRAAAGVALTQVADTIPQGFWDDRKALFGLDRAMMDRLSPHLLDQWRATMHVVARYLEDGRDYLLGDEVGAADLVGYMLLWFGTATKNPAADLVVAELPMLRPWAKRVAAIGHGERSELAADEALDIAKDAKPAAAKSEDANDPRGLKPGDMVEVLTEDPGANPVEGEIVALGPERITLKRRDPRVGDIAIHFPRIGTVVRPL